MTPQVRKKLKDRLRKGTWFRGLPAKLQDAIVDQLVPQSYAKGEVIVAQGSKVKGLYVVLDGRVAWRHSTGAAKNSLLYIAGPGAWFGHLALVRGTPVQVEVVANTAAHVLLLPRREYKRLIEDDPGHYRRIADQALDRFEILIRVYAEGRTLPAEELIPARLVTLAELRRAESGQRGGAVELTVAQSDLAEMIGVSRQTLNTALKRLEEQDLIEVGFRRLRIPDPARLQRAKRIPARAASSRGRRAARVR